MVKMSLHSAGLCVLTMNLAYVYVKVLTMMQSGAPHSTRSQLVHTHTLRMRRDGHQRARA